MAGARGIVTGERARDRAPAATAQENPFPGPQPYRASDQSRFFGREETAGQLESNVVANRCVTVYGPSGAGKSSLMQAAVIPSLIASHGIRAVRIDGWPEDEDPTRWLAAAVYAQLGLGEAPADLAPGEAIVQAAQRAARRSSRLLLVYLDQIEQLLYPGRPAAEVDAFFEHLQALADLPIRNARVVLSLREDYLGRFRDRLRDRGRLLDNGFRVGPLTVAELCDAVCQAAAAGVPPQRWSPEQMREIMLQVRVPGEAATDEAEAQAAYAQIVCRALFQERAQARDRLEGTLTGLEMSHSEASRRPTETEVAVKAERILYRYLEATLDELGPLAPEARRVLEDHLVTADGSRTLRTEKELSRVVPADKLGPILAALEGAAILHAEAHQGSRYFEIGHDWLAKRVHEQRQRRERAEEERRRAEEQEEALQKQRAETEARLAKARAQRRTLAFIALAATVLAAGAAVLTGWALRQKDIATDKSDAAQAATRRAEEQEQRANDRAIDASDAKLLAGFRELKSSGHLDWATQILLWVQRPSTARGWIAAANDALRTMPTAAPSLRSGFFHSAFIGAGGKVVASAYGDRKARLWLADGTGEPVVFEGHKEWVSSAASSPDGKRVVTASFDETARLWSADGAFERELKGHTRAVRAASFSPDSARVVTASDDMTALVWGQGEPAVLRGHTGGLTSASWSPDGEHLVTTSVDFTARLWKPDGALHHVLEGHGGEVNGATWSPNGKRLVTVSEDGTAQIWDVVTGAPLVMLEHRSPVVCAAWSPDGERLATSSADGKIRVWNADGRGEPVVLDARAPALALMFLEGNQALLSVGANDVTYTWTLDVDTLRHALRDARRACLPADVRAIFFDDESREEAAKKHAACEAGYDEPLHEIVDSAGPGRDKMRAPKGPKAPGAKPGGGRWVDVLVLPGDAAVEVDGKPARRRDGVIELLLQAGEEKQLKASAEGAAVPEKTVTIQEAAGKRAVLDLNEKPKGGKGIPSKVTFKQQ